MSLQRMAWRIAERSTEYAYRVVRAERPRSVIL